ncbi:hypothetical protein EVA_05480 [gut metagenome]|uniref:Uncharacterized protein n=1 Tax=gut metagenome TaxID=749906 RepID=J9D1F7_9ZZZZ
MSELTRLKHDDTSLTLNALLKNSNSLVLVFQVQGRMGN